MSIRILLADDHRIVCQGLAALLAHAPDLEVLGQASNGMELLRMCCDLLPDIAITDLSMPSLNGIEATHRIRAQTPSVKVLCLSVHDETQLVGAVLEAGACGYLLKDCVSEELLRAVRVVMADQIYLSPGIARVVLEDYRSKRQTWKGPAVRPLTVREREVTRLLAEGYSTKVIATRLGVSLKTVGTHREHVMHKLRIQSVAELTQYAIREGLISLSRART